ncbi:fucose isomerase [Pseudomonas sp. R2.Fl]|nr:fucose isomerase [Pseudomonas sp. R2.Fl]
MLKGLDPLLGPELLATLRAMGHGDEIAVVDGNYPALEHARRLVRADGHGIVRVLEAILSVLPIDDFVDQALFRSTVGPDADTLHPIHVGMIATCDRHAPGRPITPLVGAAFYDRVKAAHTVVHTSEPALYANMILRKGVIYPAA